MRPRRLVIDCSLGPSQEGPSRSVDLTDAELVQRERDTAEGRAAAWGFLRAERDGRLAACDWTQLADTPLTRGERWRWALYRRALRDLPEHTTDPGDVTWPTPPTREEGR